MKRQFLLFLVVTLLVACGGNPTPKSVETAPPDMHNAENALDYQGIYKGIFPAADCPGIDVTLVLNDDNTYSQHYKYLERESAFTTEGSYSVEGNTLTLHPEQADDQAEYFKVEEGRLRRLDAQKQVVEGPLKEHYVLTKTE